MNAAWIAQQFLTHPDDWMVLSPSPTAGLGMIVRKVPAWLVRSTGHGEMDIVGRPVWQGIGKLGEIFETLSKELLGSQLSVQDHTVEFRDRDEHRHRLRIKAIRLSLTSPLPDEILQLIPPPYPTHAVLMRLFDEIIPIEPVTGHYREAVRHGIVGISDPVLRMIRRIEQYGPSDASVLIQGETGTGKELVARALHSVSSRAGRAFVAINCTALNEELFESELFGHERGSFTGAFKTHKGRFERADKGTLFLDEIGDMPQRSQAKLLRVLENQTIERVGGESEIFVDVRIITATNLPLERAISRGQFRPDLFHRLAILRIHVPPLRERTGDIPLLVDFFLDMLNRRYRKNIRKVSPDALRTLESYHWPGNIRELRNVIERIYVETQGTVISRNNFREWEDEREFLMAGQWGIPHFESQHLIRAPFESYDGRAFEGNGPVHEVIPGIQAMAPRSTLRDEPLALPAAPHVNPTEISSAMPSTQRGIPFDVTDEQLIKAFHANNANMTATARALGIHKATLYRILKRRNLSRRTLSG